MRRVTVRLLVALLTFAAGVDSHALLSGQGASPSDMRRPNLYISFPPTRAMPFPSSCSCSSADENAADATSSDSSNKLRTIYGGMLNGKAICLPQPAYPPAAKTAGVSGSVGVQVLVNERGCVLSAHAVSGHPLLAAAAVAAARRACFSQTRLSGKPLKVRGLIMYNFPPR